MYKGFMLSESLRDPMILNDLSVISVTVESHPEFEGGQKIWHDFKVKVDDNKIDEICDIISGEIKDGWYAHFWNDDELRVVLMGKVFRMSREDGDWHSSEYQKCKEYAISHGVNQRYVMNFLIED